MARCCALTYAVAIGFVATASADESPKITVHPQSLALIASEDALFSVTASGTEPLVYQWRRNHTDISGATASTYPINNVQDYHVGDYEVVVTNAAGAITSTVATLTVEYPRVLANPPAAWVSVAEGGVGGEVQFSVAPLPHPPLAYQWRFNGADIQWATGSNLVVSILSVTNGGEYSVWVKTSAGGVAGPATRFEVLTVKAAREQWRTNAIPTAAFASIARMLSDNEGNLYVAANYSPAGATAAKVVKLAKAGHVLWTSDFKTQPCNCGEVSDVALDPVGNIYAAGWTLIGSGPQQAYLTAKYNAAGSNLWSVIYWFPQSPSGTSIARGVAVDGAGNVYVTGGSTGTNTVYPYDLATVKYDREGNQVWLRRYDGGQHDSGYGVALDSQTNVIVAGESMQGGLDWGVAIKYDSAGNQLWRNLDSLGNARKVVADTNDDLFVIAHAGPLTKLSGTNGHTLFSDGSNHQVVDFLADGLGRVVAIGSSFAVHSIGTDGADEWSDGLPGYASYAGTLDKRGNVYVTGALGSNCRIVKWTSDGQRAWVLDPPGVTAGIGVTVDKEFNISVANNTGTVINYEQKHRLHILGFNASGHFRLTLTGEPRVPVWLKASTNLWDWQDLATLQFSVSTADFTDTNAPAFAHRFFRTVTVTPPSP